MTAVSGASREAVIMNIIECKVNRIKNPLGFLLAEPSLSWKVVGSAGKRADKVRVTVALDEAFTKVCYDSGEKNGEEVQAVDFPLPLALSPPYPVLVAGVGALRCGGRSREHPGVV